MMVRQRWSNDDHGNGDKICNDDHDNGDKTCNMTTMFREVATMCLTSRNPGHWKLAEMGISVR